MKSTCQKIVLCFTSLFVCLPLWITPVVFADEGDTEDAVEELIKTAIADSELYLTLQESLVVLRGPQTQPPTKVLAQIKKLDGYLKPRVDKPELIDIILRTQMWLDHKYTSSLRAANKTRRLDAQQQSDADRRSLDATRKLSDFLATNFPRDIKRLQLAAGLKLNISTRVLDEKGCSGYLHLLAQLRKLAPDDISIEWNNERPCFEKSTSSEEAKVRGRQLWAEVVAQKIAWVRHRANPDPILDIALIVRTYQSATYSTTVIPEEQLLCHRSLRFEGLLKALHVKYPMLARPLDGFPNHDSVEDFSRKNILEADQRSYDFMIERRLREGGRLDDPKESLERLTPAQSLAARFAFEKARPTMLYELEKSCVDTQKNGNSPTVLSAEDTP